MGPFRARRCAASIAVALVGSLASTSAACRHSPIENGPAGSAPSAAESSSPEGAPIPQAVEAPPAPEDHEPVFPYLDDEVADVSRSIGDTSHGRVAHGAAIAESEALAILPRQKARDLAYGTMEMARLLEGAAAALFEKSRTKLWIGNVGRKGGGDIEWSVSHNAGRDADVAFSYLDGSGKSVDPPDLVSLGKDGVSKDGKLRLDLERTWITVRSLATSRAAEVEYLFIAEPLKKKLLVWARDHKEKPDVIERTANLLKQPAGSAAHDDHIHVRIFCSELDVASGCVDTGAIPPTKKTFASAREERIQHAIAQLGSNDPGARARAVLRLGLLRAVETLDRVTISLYDESADVRDAAATVLGAMGSEREAGALAKAFTAETEPRVKLRALEACLAIGGKESADLLVAAIGADVPWSPTCDASAVRLSIDLLDGSCFAPRSDVDASYIRSFAIVAAGRAHRLEVVPPLMALLDGKDRGLRVVAAESLALLTNAEVGSAWSDDAASDAHAKGRLAYEDLWRKLGKSPRDVWVAEGFRRAGFHVRAFDHTGVWELVRASAAEGHIGWNAREVLARIADEAPVPRDVPAAEACNYYLDYYRERRRKFRLDKPPDATLRACPDVKNG